MSKNPQHTLMMLLHYLVKRSTRYYSTVDNVFHAVANDQQTPLQFSDILSTQLVDMPFLMPQVMYATRRRSALFDLMI